jgi:RNA polymerase sigma-70 factor (ECF subfamily)
MTTTCRSLRSLIPAGEHSHSPGCHRPAPLPCWQRWPRAASPGPGLGLPPGLPPNPGGLSGVSRGSADPLAPTRERLSYAWGAVSSDEELMVRLQAGDEAALDDLIGRWRAPLYGFLQRRTDAGAMDDIFQETWLRVVRARARFDPRRRFSTWLFQIANNLCRDRYRRTGTIERGQAALTEELGATGRGHTPAAASQVDARLDVERGLAALPDRLREVLVLRHQRGMDEAEIAEALGIPRGTVKSRVHAAMRALRAVLAPDEESP